MVIGRELTPGEPLDPATKLGSMVDERQMDKVLGYVRLGEEEGARVVAGGMRVREDSGGYFVAPTIFDGATNQMRIAREEIFGPVLSVLTFRTPDEAVAKANNSPYGLRLSNTRRLPTDVTATGVTNVEIMRPRTIGCLDSPAVRDRKAWRTRST